MRTGLTARPGPIAAVAVLLALLAGYVINGDTGHFLVHTLAGAAAWVTLDGASRVLRGRGIPMGSLIFLALVLFAMTPDFIYLAGGQEAHDGWQDIFLAHRSLDNLGGVAAVLLAPVAVYALARLFGPAREPPPARKPQGPLASG